MNREEKSVAIEEIAAQIQGAEAIFAVDYRGITVAQAAELRSKLRENDASFRVVKNRLTKLAADKAGEERLTGLLQGPTALTFVRGDTAAAAKAITTFNKVHDVLTFKGGFMEGLDLDDEKFQSIARLPSRNVLDGQLAGVVASPLTGLVRGLGSMISGLALQLGQIAEKGLVTGEAPAEEPEPAAAEASDAVAEVADEGGQDDGAPADGSGSEAEQSSDDSSDDVPSSTPPADDSSEAPAAEEPEAPEADAEETPAGASDEVADQADEGGQDDGTPADDSGSEAEQSSVDGEAEQSSDDSSDDSDTSETDKKEEE
jgi:large subunit ribosomal protein L10